MHLKVESISPAKARKYLETNHENQRYVKHTKVARFKQMILEGVFNGLNGESIKFAKNGQGDILIDGQHRLLGIVESGKTVPIAVVRGLSKDSFTTLDQGENRTVENFYQIANVQHARISSQIAKWLYYQEFGGSPLRWTQKTCAPIPGLIAKWSLEKHPNIPTIIDRITDHLGQFQKKGLGTKNHLGYCYYLWQELDAIDAYNIVRYLGSGEGEIYQTIRSMREYLMTEGQKDRETGVPGTTRGSKVVNALNVGWNSVRSGKKNIKSFSRLVHSYDKSLQSKTDTRSFPVTKPI